MESSPEGSVAKAEQNTPQQNTQEQGIPPQPFTAEQDPMAKAERANIEATNPFRPGPGIEPPVVNPNPTAEVPAEKKGFTSKIIGMLKGLTGNKS